MGTDCAPLLANLFLFYYEDKFMEETKQPVVMLFDILMTYSR